MLIRTSNEKRINATKFFIKSLLIIPINFPEGKYIKQFNTSRTKKLESS